MKELWCHYTATLVACALPIIFISSGNCTQQPQNERETDILRSSSKTLCGLYSMYSAARVLGLDPKASDILNLDYVSSDKGSTLEDLCKVAEKQGLYTSVYRNIAVRSLKCIREPVILSVASEPGSFDYDHYILLLRAKGNSFAVWDPPSSPKWIEASELTLKWSGIGLVVSTHPVSKYTFLSVCLTTIAPWVTGTIVGIFALILASRLLKRRAAHRSLTEITVQSTSAEVACILGMTLFFGALVNSVQADGLMRNAQVVRAIQGHNAVNLVPRLSAKDLETAMKQHVVLVDARWKQDYEMGHLQGAINIEPDSSTEKIAEALSNISRGQPIIVYCQSVQCPYAKEMIVSLFKQGYTALSYFPGGYEEWNSTEGRVGAL